MNEFEIKLLRKERMNWVGESSMPQQFAVKAQSGWIEGGSNNFMIFDQKRWGELKT